jgi:hypothetical protein
VTAVTKGERKGRAAAAARADKSGGTAARSSSRRSPKNWIPKGWAPTSLPLLILACAVFVAAAGCLFLWRKNAEYDAVKRAREDALAAAQSSAKDLLSYNYRTLDYDLGKARAEMTPAMARSYDAYWRLFRPSVEKSQTQALTQIQVAGVTQATRDRVEVLLFVKMISVNAAHKEPQVDTSWPRLQMKKVGKRWLIDGPRMTTPPPAASAPVATPSPSAPASTAPKAPAKPKPRRSH